MNDLPAGMDDHTLEPVIERYDPDRHLSSEFACGKPSLDQYIQTTAASDERTHAAAVFVMVDPTEGGLRRRILGYFTLSAFAFQRDQARRRDRDKSLPGYLTVPALLIGRFALDQAHHGRGLGSTLLVAALSRALRLSGELGIAVVVVHALDDDAVRFYVHQGFVAFKDEPHHLYYPMTSIVTALGFGL